MTREPIAAELESKTDAATSWLAQRSRQALIDAIAERERREFQESLAAQFERLQRRSI